MSFNSSNMSLSHWGASWLRLLFGSALMCSPPLSRRCVRLSPAYCRLSQCSLEHDLPGEAAQTNCVAVGAFLAIESKRERTVSIDDELIVAVATEHGRRCAGAVDGYLI